MTAAAIILAAGASRRMGRVKALLPVEGETFLDRLIRVLGAECAPVIAVLGYHAETIQSGMRRPAQIVINPHPENGQLSSLQCALRALPATLDAFLFTPVDYPAFAPATVAGLLAALSANPAALLAIPRHDGTRGHPVACRASLAAEFLALPPDAQARTVIHAHRPETVFVDVDDPFIAMDVDDPAAYERLLAVRP